MTALGFVLFWGVISIFIGFVIFLWGYHMGGTWESGFWTRRIDNLQKQLDTALATQTITIYPPQSTANVIIQPVETNFDWKDIDPPKETENASKKTASKSNDGTDSRKPTTNQKRSGSKAFSRKRRS